MIILVNYEKDRYKKGNETFEDNLKRVAKYIASNDEEYKDVIDELIDRFGDFPDDVKYLIDLTFLKNIMSTEDFVT